MLYNIEFNMNFLDQKTKGDDGVFKPIKPN